MLRRKTVFFLAIVVITTFFFTIYSLFSILPGTGDVVRKNYGIEKAIFLELKILPEVYKDDASIEESKIDLFFNRIKNINLELNKIYLKDLWDEANSWPSANQLTNISSPNIGKILYALKHALITKADLDTRGTQLKILLTLKGDQQCVFKPKWYSKEKVIEGPVYAGKDRYGSEIVAFYLSVLLEKYLTPVSVERTLSLKYDILPVATKRLANTSFERDNKTCIYGKCFYCRKEDPVCDDVQNLLTGAVIFNINRSFTNYRSPWQRTYKRGKQAPWENNPNYCKNVRNKLNKKRLLDLVDTAIFDFLLQNGDRHHYEVLEDTVVWVDNGKGLGNPHVQHIDILAPLYQCCIIRGKTWKSLQKLAGGNLSKYLNMMPDVYNVLTQEHLRTMEERLLLIFATVEYCKKKKDS